MTAAGVGEQVSRSALGADVAVGLAAATVWTFAVAAHLGFASISPGAMVELLGAASLAFVPCTALLRQARPVRPGLDALLAGIILAIAPVSLEGALLQQRTHHRALGGLTFAVLALATVLASALVARRLLTLSRDGSRLGQAARAVLVIALVASMAWIVRSLVAALSAASSVGVRSWVLDGAVGLVLLITAVSGPRFQLSSRASRGVAALALGIVALGAVRLLLG